MIILCWGLDLLLNILKLSSISLVTKNSDKLNLMSTTAEVENSLHVVIEVILFPLFFSLQVTR